MFNSFKDTKRAFFSVVTALLLVTAPVGELLASESGSNVAKESSIFSLLSNGPGIPPWPQLLGLE